jgi:putative transposase
MEKNINNENIGNDMVMQKSFKFRIYPIRKQEKRLEKCLDQACFLYNQLLDIHQQVYLGMGETLSEFDMNRLNTDFELKNLHSSIKQNVSKRISDAFNHFFRKMKNGGGFPKFKKRIFYSSITFPQYNQEMYPNRLYVSKVGMIKIVKHREIEGIIKTLTIKKENDEWYAIFSCENVPTEEPIKEFNSETEGLDVGIKKFLVCSDGREYDNPNFMKRSEKKLIRIQRRHSRKKKGSMNRVKSRIRLAKLHTKIKRQREDFHKKLARQLASEIKYIGIENLNIQGMVKNHYLARSISDVGWGSFFAYLKYYKTIFGGKIIEIERFEPTSQTCSNCWHKQEMPLKERFFRCSNCGLTMDRDLNASINIQKLVKQKLNNTEGHSGFQACGLDVRPSMKAIEIEAGNYRKTA